MRHNKLPRATTTQKRNDAVDHTKQQLSEYSAAAAAAAADTDLAASKQAQPTDCRSADSLAAVTDRSAIYRAIANLPNLFLLLLLLLALRRRLTGDGGWV